jgi:hypothetical protein
MRNLVAVVVTLLVTAGLPPHAVSRAALCGDANAKTVLQGRDSRVYQRRLRGAPRPFQLFACTRGAEPTFLDDPRDNVYAFGVPAIALAGPLVGYAQTGLDEEGADFDTSVVVSDLRQPDRLVAFAPASRVAPLAKVGSLVLRRSGGMAWIACPETDPEPIGDRSPSCVRRGALDRVYRLNAGTKRPQLLDKGRSIDPSSLRSRGSSVTWVSNGRRRSAALR